MPDNPLASILDLAQAALDLPDEATWWGAVAAAILGSLFHADVVAVNTLNINDRYGWFSEVFPVAARRAIPLNSAMDEVLLHDHPFSERLSAGPVEEPLSVTDLVSERTWRHSAAYDRMRELTGATNHLTLHLPRVGAHVESLSIVRADGDFNEHEMELAGRLQAVVRLGTAHLRAQAECRDGWTPAALQAANNAARELHITERERGVLELLQAGLPTNRVGRALGISPRTVYKHQQNLYRKLRVNDRHNALRAAQERLLLPST